MGDFLTPEKGWLQPEVLSQFDILYNALEGNRKCK